MELAYESVRCGSIKLEKFNGGDKERFLFQDIPQEGHLAALAAIKKRAYE